MRPSHLALAVLLVAAAPSPARADGTTSATGDGATSLPLTIRCEACEAEAPTLNLLWRVEGSAEPMAVGTLVARDWSRGSFVLSEPAGDTELQASPVEGGWIVAIPVEGRGLPFRIVGVARGFVADRAAWWPSSDAAPISMAFSPVADVLDAHPAWDPARSPECELLVPKSAETPLVFYSGNQPRAWLFPEIGSTTEPSPRWTFQFVRPGRSPLERMSVPVMAFDEGDSWAMRVPFAPLVDANAPPLAGQSELPREIGDAGQLQVVGAAAADAAVGATVAADLRTVDFARCPRVVR